MHLPAFPIAIINFLYSCLPDGPRIPILDSMTFFCHINGQDPVHSFAHSLVRITRENEVGWRQVNVFARLPLR
jgi:hypothetical protein